MNRRNHYEAAFEGFLRDKRLPYVAVDESKRALFSGSKLKSFDFVVYSRGGPNLLIDVKGRKAVDRSGEDKPFQTWATRRDVDDLWSWQRIFGDEFRGMLAFVYEVTPVLVPPPGHFVYEPTPGVSRHYRLMGVDLRTYRDGMARRSERWDTVSLPAGTFREAAKPMEQWL